MTDGGRCLLGKVRSTYEGTSTDPYMDVCTANSSVAHHHLREVDDHSRVGGEEGRRRRRERADSRPCRHIVETVMVLRARRTQRGKNMGTYLPSTQGSNPCSEPG